MFGIIAALIFSTAFGLSIASILYMFATYRRKMVAALLLQPMPEEPAQYRVRVSRRRGPSVPAPNRTPLAVAG